ncbi:MAG: hypothetical protein LBQ78_05715 [Tannerellaceae bacterium]|jgi:hypothetical protein|nr:hypothetical protein [Tannerellaceae bacterium]
MKHIIIYYIAAAAWLVSCTHRIPEGKEADSLPALFPDYAGVRIPYNIAPLNFALINPSEEAYARFDANGRQLTVKAGGGQFTIPPSAWRKLLAGARGGQVAVTIHAKRGEWIRYPAFYLYVAKEPVDPYLAYRLIEPGYELWNRMGIYQRDLEGNTQSAIIENKMSGNNCINCHSFCMQNPEKMLFHMRRAYAGTLLTDGDKIEKLNTKTDHTISPLAYPSWHPSGRYIAFSVNKTEQSFHLNHRNRIEVYDNASDVVVYDVEKHEIVTTPALFSQEAFETFPTFSPDGKTLYFCTANALPMPEAFERMAYSLCAISFDAENRRFGAVADTLYNAAAEGGSVSFPRVSPDGKFLLYTLSGYGNFSIWHKDADLHLFHLATKKHFPLDILNSDDVESYHSWSSNGRWVVFSSRRMDGLYTRPYIAYINEEGKASKPFLLPQKDTAFYHRLMKSYNIPEFITGKVKRRGREFGLKAKKEKGINVIFLE